MFEFLTHPVPAVIVLLGVLVFVHELGHFLAGVWCGAGVEVFSLGFGPRAVGVRHKGTDYRVSWIPLGGFVKLTGMVASEPIPPGFEGKEFFRLPVWKKTTIIAAGPLANFALAIVAYALLGANGIPHAPSNIGYVMEGGAADRGGLIAGDRVVAIDGRNVTVWGELEQAISKSAGKALAVKVERSKDGKNAEVMLSVAPDLVRRRVR